MEPGRRQAALDRARQGDGQALGDLLQSFRPYVRAIVQALRNGQAPARIDDSDLIQDALLEVHRSFAGFHGGSVAEFVVWLRQIVLRSAGHTLRSLVGTEKRSPERELPGEVVNELADSGSTPSGRAIRHEESVRLADALARLPEDMQQVLLGRFLDDLPYAVLAGRLGRSEAAVRVLYTRALRRLRQEYQD